MALRVLEARSASESLWGSVSPAVEVKHDPESCSDADVDVPTTCGGLVAALLNASVMR